MAESDESRSPRTPMQRGTIPEPTTAVLVRFGPWPTLALLIIVLVALWGAAEAHDNNCYTKATARAVSEVASGGEPTETNCLLLPWNEP